MAKMKVYELAKQLNIDSKEIISIAKDLGIKLSSHLSSIDDTGVERIKKNMNNDKSQKKDEIKTTGQKLNCYER